MDDETIAVVRLKVSPIDVDRYIAFIADAGKAWGVSANDLERAGNVAPKQGAVLNEWIGKFIQAGGKTIYAVVDLGDAPTVRLAVPLEGDADADALGRLLVPAGERAATQPADPPSPDGIVSELIPDARAEVIGRTLVVATPYVLRSLKRSVPAPRPELEAVLAACGDAPLAIAITPIEGVRTAAALLLPRLPKEVGGGPTSIVTEGVRWLALSYDPPPKAALHVTVQAKDANAAGELRRIGEDALEEFKDRVRGRAPSLDRFIRTASLTVAGDRLKLDIADQNTVLAGDDAGPPDTRARHEASRAKSANNLR